MTTPIFGTSVRAEYESLSRGDLIDLLCSRDASSELPPHVKRRQTWLENELAAARAACRSLERDRARLSVLFEDAPTPYCVIDRASVVLDSNTAAARLFGRAREELLGSPLARIAGLRDDSAFMDHVAHCLDEHVRAVTTLDVELRAAALTLQVTSAPIDDACLTAFHDVTSLAEGLRDARFIAAVNESLVDAGDLATLGQTLVRACVPTLGDVSFADVQVGSRLRRVAMSPAPESAAGQILERHARDAGWRAYAERTMSKLSPVFEPTSASAFGAPFDRELGARALMLAPLAWRGDTFGVLGVLLTSSRAPTMRDFEKTLRVARAGSIALARTFS